jgi:hypothetical protein
LTASTLVKDFDAKTLLGTKMSVRSSADVYAQEVAISLTRFGALNDTKGDGFMAAMTLLPLVSSSAKDMEK